MLVTLFGMVMDVKLVHPLNVNCSMVVMLIPLGFRVGLAEFKGKHIGSLAHNHNVIDDSMI